MRSRRAPLALVSGVLTGLALVTGAGFAAGPATAQAPRGGPVEHTHHLHTGNGECVDIDSVRFDPGHRGLHQGANSSGPDRGPWHGTCDSRLYPGGPTLVSVGFPVHH